MPFIKITAAEDKAAGRGVGAPAVLPRSRQAAVKKKWRKWIPVRSSWIKAVKFNPPPGGGSEGTLDIMHLTGKVYSDYPRMSRQMMYGLLQVRSAGRWVWRYYPPRHVPTSTKPGSKPTKFGKRYHKSQIKGQRRI